MKLTSITTPLILLSVFVFAFVTGAILLGTHNNPDRTIGNDPALAPYLSSINESLAKSAVDAQKADSAISNSSVTLTTGFPVFDAISGVWKTLRSVPMTVWNLTAGLLLTTVFQSQAGAFAVVIGAIGAILLIFVIVAAWRLVSTGDG